MKETPTPFGSPAGAEAPGGRSTLADLLKERGALPEPEIARIFGQVLDDLELAHSQAMLHRDISPARIVLEGGVWKPVDYGKSKIGTVRYMSPERCQGRAPDARSDTYSLGIVLFEAATGRVPFDAEMKFQVMEAQISKDPPMPRGLNQGISTELERVILRAISKNPANRYQTATEFKTALEGAIKSAPDRRTSVRPPPPGSRPTLGATPYRERGRVRPGVIIVPLLLVAVAAGAYFFLKSGGPKVPSVIGMTREQVAAALKAKGMEAVTDYRDDTLPAGLAVAQEPKPGGKTRDKRVTVYVSTGMVEVPLLGGLTIEQTRDRLKPLALTISGTESTYSDSVGAGTVAGSNPKAGARLAPHSSVKVTLSQGRATCPQCGVRRQGGARFCTNCGYKYL